MFKDAPTIITSDERFAFFLKQVGITEGKLTLIPIREFEAVTRKHVVALPNGGAVNHLPTCYDYLIVCDTYSFVADRTKAERIKASYGLLYKRMRYVVLIPRQNRLNEYTEINRTLHNTDDGESCRTLCAWIRGQNHSGNIRR